MKSPNLQSRRDFAPALNEIGLTGTAVEVGTDRGIFAYEFMSLWQGRELMCVDPYRPYDEMFHSRECDKMQAVIALQRFWPRVRFYEVESPKAVDCVMWWNRPLDFIYIDASHLYENVIRDLRAWYPLLAKGGIFAGHDYDDEHPGVMRAVDEFAAELGKTILVTHEAKCPSWYFQGGPS